MRTETTTAILWCKRLMQKVIRKEYSMNYKASRNGRMGKRLKRLLTKKTNWTNLVRGPIWRWSNKLLCEIKSLLYNLKTKKKIRIFKWETNWNKCNKHKCKKRHMKKNLRKCKSLFLRISVLGILVMVIKIKKRSKTKHINSKTTHTCSIRKQSTVLPKTKFTNWLKMSV